MFGAEALGIMDVRECSVRGAGFKGGCEGVDGYPSWRGMGGEGGVRGGEMELGVIAELSAFKGFDQKLEPVKVMQGGDCKLR